MAATPSPSCDGFEVDLPNTDLLTSAEKELVERLGSLAIEFSRIATHGCRESSQVPYDRDLDDAVIHIHALQNIVLSQAAARAYPEMFRLFGVRCVRGSKR